ncbi:tRNA-intron endonuclease catalytic domain-like protein [Meira miltonrushii]|uniref:tRNA-intron lyase n=1 Tax=Meira miltonrushii TaxID=1280837 RepID=A0A316VIQ5_9BASI|nr:tRNA-intron endonuclease catalytic domain-like protein [Meira miltonrushii]PWN36938.1 tRNA-intron endonuclease catalytic domain-like protein [Meira miltonrushii]
MEEGGVNDEDDNSGLFAPPPDNNEDDSAQKNATNEAWKTISHPITIATNSLELPWRIVKVGENAFDTLSGAAKAGLWHYPNTPMQAARCATFEDLRSRGYYMAKGLRFGGDLNVYPGDLLRYHSHFTATIQCKPEQDIPAQELVSAGRLGTAVKKAHLLCTVTLNAPDQDESQIRQARLEGKDDLASVNSWGSVDYFSLTWAGFGT